jgi:hypothetical protein
MVKTLTRSAARVYGALSALGDGSTDVLERLLPFFDPILRPKQGTRLDLDAFAKEVRETYKWNFNTDIVEVFIPRLVDAGWLTPDDPNIKQTTYTISLPDQILEPDTEASVNEQLRQIAEKFKAFSESLSPLTAIPREVEEFEDILIEWLLYVEAFSEQNLDFKIEIRKDNSGKLRQVVEVPQTTSLKDEEKFLCARFVQHAISTDPAAAEVLARIASIGLLTEVVQDFVKPNTPVETSSLVVYLDAPVALELLGVSGKSARENTIPIVSELQRIGVNIRIFGQSVDEMKQSLQSVLQNPRPIGPTAQAIARGEVFKDYVAEVSRGPEPFLEALGVKVAYRTLEKFPTEHEFFTDEQRTEIYGALAFQQNNYARAHDADITTLVMRQRKGNVNRDLFESRFFVLTRNGLLAQLVRRKCVELGILSPNAVPPVVHRRVLSAAMWLRTGLGAQDLEIPKRMLLASCERVLAIRPGVVEAVRKLTDALGDEEMARQLDLLVAQDRSAQMLMDKTLGAPSVVTEANLPHLFQEMLQPHLEEERKKAAKAVKEETAKGKRKLDKVQEELDTERKAKSDTAARLEAEYLEDHKIVKALCSEVEGRLAKLRKRNKFVGLILAIIFCVPAVFLPSDWRAYLSIALAIPLAYLTITGNKLLGTKSSGNTALSALETAANTRRLDAKMSRFNIEWKDEHFSVSERNDTIGDDLITANVMPN